MGKLTKARNHLFNLLPHCFAAQCPVRSFQRVVVDLMQYVSGSGGKDETFSSQDLINRVQKTLRFYVHEREGEYEIEETLILLLDSPLFVPALKAVTQKTRDKTPVDEAAEASDEGDGDETTTTHDEGVSRERRGVMDTQLFRQLREQNAGRSGGGDKVDEHLLIDEFTRVASLDRTTLRRSVNLRQQTLRVITHAILLWNEPLPERLVVLLDDGLAIRADCYCDQRSAMIDDYDFHGHSEFAKECLVATLSRQHFNQRLYLYADGAFARQCARPVGEADIKVCHYITPQTERVVVASQDTDSIFILLLHLKTLLDPRTGRPPDALELWLDMRTPRDEAERRNRPYRFVDVKRLYLSIVQLFAEEYPSVQNPIETFVALVYSLETDFTRAFHPYLRIYPSSVWNAFSELHSKRTTIRGYLLFNAEEPVAGRTAQQSRKRGFERLLPSQLYGVLARGVDVRYNETMGSHEIELDEPSWERFYYLLCQLRLRADLASIGYSEYADQHGNRYILETDEIFMKIAELEEKIVLCRQAGLDGIRDNETQSKQQFLSLLEQEKKAIRATARPSPIRSRYDTREKKENTNEILSLLEQQPQQREAPPSSSPRNSKVTWSDFDFEMAGVGATPLIDKAIVTLSKKTIPPHLGIPSLRAMLACIYQRRWLLNYHQNGWISPDYALNFDQVHESNRSLSLHGWKTREIAQTEETVARGEFNNTYHLMRPVGGPPIEGKIPFRVYETEETDEVYNRRHEYYVTRQHSLVL